MRQIPDYAYLVLDRIKENGYEAYIVGGAVRDLYLDREIHDIDINTNMLPDEIKEMFSDYEQSNRGEKHGTITIIVGNKYNRVEVTTYRIDAENIDSRYPQSETFNANLVEDLSRRDYTMNTMCYDGYGKFIDLFNAKRDIDNKLIKVIGKGNQRFEEDAIRIMRGFRFVAQLGFRLDPETKKAMTESKEKLRDVIPERICLEFFEIIRAEYSSLAIRNMIECGVLAEYIAPLTRDEFKIYDKAESFHLRLFLLLRYSYEMEDNLIAIGKKRAGVFACLEKNIEKYPNGLPNDRNKLKEIIRVNGAKNVKRLAEYFVINSIQPGIILNLVEEVRYNWNSYGSSSYNSSSGNLRVVNINEYIKYDNEDLAITKEQLLSKTKVTEEYVDEVYDYLFNCVRCNNFINNYKVLIDRARIKMDKIIAKLQQEQEQQKTTE